MTFRKLVSILLVTYLPTVLMNMINQATNYITTEDKYSLILQINITCMMVLASVYLSVSASLPTTSGIKPVEVWLLVNLGYPFLVILVNIAQQAGTLEDLTLLVTRPNCRFYTEQREGQSLEDNDNYAIKCEMTFSASLVEIRRKYTTTNKYLCRQFKVCVGTIF